MTRLSQVLKNLKDPHVHNAFIGPLNARHPHETSSTFNLCVNPPCPVLCAYFAAELTASSLTGKYVALKDNICTIDQPTTCASKILHGFQSPFDATVVEKLKASGALILGKTNMDEFGMG